MSDVVFTRCTSCNTKLKLKTPDIAGKKIRCPKCKAVFVAKLEEARSSANANKPKPLPVTATDDATDQLSDDTVSKPEEKSAAVNSAGDLVSWEEGIGDDKKFNIAYVSSDGITLVPKMKDYAEYVQAVAQATSTPDDAVEILSTLPKAVQFAPSDISKVTYAEQLTQLWLYDQDNNRTKVPDGKEQADVFAAIKTHLGGSESEEEADAWAVMQTPLFILAVISVIGGFFIWFTTICDPNYEASGRRSGMKALMNWVGYKIGPIWMSVMVGSLAALVLGLMIFQLIKRPMRQVLQYPVP